MGTNIHPEDKSALSKLVEATRNNFNDRFDEIRRHWGGGVNGNKSLAKIANSSTSGLPTRPNISFHIRILFSFLLHIVFHRFHHKQLGCKNGGGSAFPANHKHLFPSLYKIARGCFTLCKS